MKKVLLTFILLFSALNVCAADNFVCCDFDGNQESSDNDLMILVSFFQVKLLAAKGWATLDIATVQKKARTLLNNQNLVVSRLPVAADMLEDASRSDLNDNDLMLLVAYFQTRLLAGKGLATLDFSTVEQKAGRLLNNSAIRISKFPETPIGNVGIPFTFTGIQVDSPD